LSTHILDDQIIVQMQIKGTKKIKGTNFINAAADLGCRGLRQNRLESYSASLSKAAAISSGAAYACGRRSSPCTDRNDDSGGFDDCFFEAGDLQ